MSRSNPAQEPKNLISADVYARTGIDEAMIDRLVRAFYGRVRQDPILGPIFEARVEDWEAHFQRIDAFWSSLILKTRGYDGVPVRKHVSLPVSGEHFERWLALFESTASELCPPEAAALFIERARRIARSMEFAVAAHRGCYLEKGARLGTPEDASGERVL